MICSCNLLGSQAIETAWFRLNQVKWSINTLDATTGFIFQTSMSTNLRLFSVIRSNSQQTLVWNCRVWWVWCHTWAASVYAALCYRLPFMKAPKRTLSSFLSIPFTSDLYSFKNSNIMYTGKINSISTWLHDHICPHTCHILCLLPPIVAPAQRHNILV